MVNTCVLLDGPVKNDARVQRVINSLCEKSNVYLFYVNGEELDCRLFSDKVKLFSLSINNNWLQNNLFFHQKFANYFGEVMEKGIQFNYIYCNDYPLLYVSIKIKRAFENAKLIYDSHEIYIETINQFFPVEGVKKIYGNLLINFNKYYHKNLEKRLIKKVDYVITVCDSFKTYFERMYNLSDVKVLKNCPNQGVEIKKKDILREKLKLEPDCTILIYQGSFNKGRGLEKLLRASEKFDENIEMVYLGDGPLKSELIENISYKRKKNIHLLETVPYDELFEHTASADVGLLFIQPFNDSKKLTLPNKLFEYMAASIPVLANNLPECVEIIKECKCGVNINDENEDNIAFHVNQIHKSSKKMKELGRNGEKYYKKKYYWENQVKVLLDIID